MPQPPEGGHDLIRDIKDVVRAADLKRAFTVFLGRDDHTAGTQDRLSYESANALWSDLRDRTLKIGYLGVAPCFLGHAVRPDIRINIREKSDKTILEVETAFVTLFARDTRRQIGRPVIAFFPCKDCLLYTSPSPRDS